MKRDESLDEDQESNCYSYLDPDKRLRVSDNTLKLIQKQALLDYYQRHKVKIENCGNGDSGFYSPTGPPRHSDHSAVINGTDHPDQSSTELNGLEVS